MSAKARPYVNKPFPLRLSVEPRAVIAGWLPAAISAGAVVLALIIGAIILALAGGDPLSAYAQIARSSFGGLDDFFIFGVWSEGGFQMSATFPRNAWLPRLADFATAVPAFSGLTTHLGLLFAAIAAVLVWLILNRSRWGYEIRLIGDNARAAEYA